MAAAESIYCPPCNSFFHSPDNCPKTLPPTYKPVSNKLIGSSANISVSDFRLISQLDPQHFNIDPTTATLDLELQLRWALSKGIGNGGRRCDKHRKMQLQMLGKARWNQKNDEPIVPDAFDDGFVATRTLLPICSACVHDETGLEQRALASGLDMCRCATMITAAACPNCVLGEINGALKCELLRKTDSSTDEACKTACRCGNEVDAAETARQCAYCRGIATAPFYGYAGQELDFSRDDETATLSNDAQHDEKDVV